ncbi:hypothetical protein PO878_12785 [Iamia majanohamensis]|uniref:Uncharacterized protein n=1 Tax=Iamia majanohamensis TaxID=467976 RepID=A0AAE9YAE3_9ACTN|nr:hypothetical protein [Iamia majanohamensis]WCO65372.1 hypothetical protein PO878_12785 [Iamia majanohamensis]
MASSDDIIAGIKADYFRRQRRRQYARLTIGILLPFITAPAFGFAALVAYAAVGCTSPTMGGLAGRENDPCRDGGWALLLSLAVCLALWLVSSALVWRWARRPPDSH